MRSHSLLLSCFVGVFCTFTSISDCEADFINLDFELANVSNASQGTFPSVVPFVEAFPGWTGYFDNIPVTQAVYNSYTLGLYNISILGRPWNDSVFPIIQGNHAAILQAGYTGIPPFRSASLKQTGLVPSSAITIEIRAGYVQVTDPNFSRLRVTLGGTNIQMLPVQFFQDYAVLRGNISSFAGQTRELTITAIPIAIDPNASFVLDQIVFSNSPIPEPSSLEWCGLSCCLLSYRNHRSRKEALQ